MLVSHCLPSPVAGSREEWDAQEGEGHWLRQESFSGNSNEKKPNQTVTTLLIAECTGEVNDSHVIAHYNLALPDCTLQQTEKDRCDHLTMC